MPATKMIGHLSFSKPDIAIAQKLGTAREEFQTKHAKHTPTKLMLHPDNQEHEAMITGWAASEGLLPLIVVFTNSVLPNHIWIGAPEKGNAPSVRQSSRARVLQADAGVGEVAVPVVVDEHDFEVTSAGIAVMRDYFRVARRTLPAPKIAGLLCAVNPVTEPATDEDEGEEPIAVLLPSGMRKARIRAMFERQSYDHIAPFPPLLLPAVSPSTAALLSRRDLRANVQAIESLIALCELYGDASGEIVFTERTLRLSVAAAPIASVLPQQLQDAGDVRTMMHDLAAQKKKPDAFNAIPPHNSFSYKAHKQRREQDRARQAARSNEALSNEALLEEAAMDRATVPTDKIGDFLEALEYAVNHREDEQAQLLPDGHRFARHGKQGHIKVKHPSLKVEAMLVAVRLHKADGYRFVVRRNEVRSYLDECAREFEAKKIMPISAGEKYPGEVRAA